MAGTRTGRLPTRGSSSSDDCRAPGARTAGASARSGSAHGPTSFRPDHRNQPLLPSQSVRPPSTLHRNRSGTTAARTPETALVEGADGRRVRTKLGERAKRTPVHFPNRELSLVWRHRGASGSECKPNFMYALWLI